MGIRSSLGLPVKAHQEVVVRPRPAATCPPPFAVKVLGPSIILLVAVVGMSQLAVSTTSLPREGHIAMAIARSPRTSPLLGVPSAPATVVEPTHLAATPTAVEAVTDVSAQAQPVLTAVAAVLRSSPASAAPRPVPRHSSSAAPRPVLRPSPSPTAPRSVAPPVAVSSRPSPPVVVAQPPVPRVRGKSRQLQTERGGVGKNRVHTPDGPTSSDADRTA